MNEKNSFGLNYCFKDLENPLDLFSNWFKQGRSTKASKLYPLPSRLRTEMEIVVMIFTALAMICFMV